MSLEEPESKYVNPIFNPKFIADVGGLLQMLYEDYSVDDFYFERPPFEGETFLNVYFLVYMLVHHKPNCSFWTEERALYLSSSMVYWNYMVKVKKMTEDELLKTKNDKEKIAFKWALSTGWYEHHFYCSTIESNRFNELVDMFGLEDKSWVRKLKVNSTNLEHLRDYHSLAYLNLSLERGNEVAIDISPLSHLTKLSYLFIYNFHSIVDYSPLSNLTNLSFLMLTTGGFVDLRPLANLTNLTNLELSYCTLSDIHSLVNLTKLTYLILSNTNHITDISPVSKLKNLTYLNLNKNQIVDLSPLSNLVGLSCLHLSKNLITDISPLSGLVELKHLSLDGNPITDVSSLSGLVELKHLNLRSTLVTTIDPLSSLTKLTELCITEANA